MTATAEKISYRPIPPVAQNAPMTFSTPKWAKAEHGYWTTPCFDMGDDERGDNIQVKYSVSGVMLPSGVLMFEACRFDYKNRMTSCGGSRNTEWGILYPTLEAAQNACQERHATGFWPTAPSRVDLGLTARDAKFTEEQVRLPHFPISASPTSCGHVFSAARAYLRITRGDTYADLADGQGFRVEGDDLIIKEYLPFSRSEAFGLLCAAVHGYQAQKRTRELRLPLWILWKGTDFLNVKMK